MIYQKYLELADNNGSSTEICRGSMAIDCSIDFLPKSHAMQGVISYKLLAETFVTSIKNLDWWKLSLIVPFWGSWSLDYARVQRTKVLPFYFSIQQTYWLVTKNLHWSLDQLLRGTLIAWFHFDPISKSFCRWHVSDYPCNWKALKCKPRPCSHQVPNSYLVVYVHVSATKRYQVCNNDWCHCKTKFTRVPPV